MHETSQQLLGQSEALTENAPALTGIATGNRAKRMSRMSPQIRAKAKRAAGQVQAKIQGNPVLKDPVANAVRAAPQWQRARVGRRTP